MTTDTVGGVWTYSRELTSGLLQAGVAVALAIVGRQPDGSQASWLRETEESCGPMFAWEVVDAPLEWMNDNQEAYLGAEPALLRLAQNFHPDLLHSNQFCFGALPVNIPRVVVAHSDVLSWSVSCDHPIDPCPWLEQYSTLVQNGLTRASAVIAPTRWMLAALLEGFEVTCPRFVVHNGRTLPFSLKSRHRKAQLVTAGRLWDEAKNLRMLAGLDLPLPLFIAGEQIFEANSSPLLPNGAVALGPLPEDALLQLFQQSVIYLCTSRYEPFGLAALEAGLCGCAVVAFDITSLHEVWGESAHYFSNTAELLQLLARLVREPQSLREAQRRSWVRASHYSRKRMTDHYLATYRHLLQSPNGNAYVA